jgi:predicted transcriptional regulator
MPAKKNTTVISEPTASTRPPVDAPDLPPAAVTVLAVLDPENPATTAEVVGHTGLARSTVTKALTVLRDAGLATRQDGGHDGALRIADRWYAAPWKTEQTAIDGSEQAPEDSDDETAAPQAEPEAAAEAPVLPLAVQKVLGLLDIENPTTATEVLERAGLGRSTVNKALSALADAGLAVRREVGSEGGRPVAARWFAAPGPTDPDAAPVESRQEPADDVAAEPHGDSAANQQGEPAPVAQPADDETVADGSDDPTADATAEGVAAATALSAVPDGTGPADPTEAPDNGPDDSQAANGASFGAAEPDGEPGQPVVEPGLGAESVTDREQPALADAEPVPARLGKGELRTQVEEHLRANSEKAFTPTEIHHVLNRSSGAIANLCGSSEDGAPRPRRVKGELRASVAEVLAARPDLELSPTEIANVLGASAGAVANALDRLVSDGSAVLTCERPRRFRSVGS